MSTLIYNNDFTVSGTRIRIGRKFISNAKRLNLTNKKEWLEKLFDTGKVMVYMNNEEGVISKEKYLANEPSIKAHFFNIVDKIREYYGDNWDIDFNVKEGNEGLIFLPHFQIRYPEIEISNSNGVSRIIKELICVLHYCFSNDEGVGYLAKPRAIRYQQNQDEWFSGYLHSHISRDSRRTNLSNITRADTFCLGHSELSEMLMVMKTEHEPEILPLFFNVLDGFVQWESLEGGPYIEMKNIIEPSFQKPIPGLTNTGLNRITQEIMESINDHIKELKVDFTFSEGRFKIINNKKYNDFIRDVIMNFCGSSARDFVCKKLDGVYYSIPSQEVEQFNEIKYVIPDLIADHGSVPFVYIQGKAIEFKLDNINQIEFNPEEYSVYPAILKNVSRKYESQLYTATIRSSGIKKYHTSSSTRRGIAQN